MDQVGAFVDRGEIPGAVLGLWCDGDMSLLAKGVTVFGGDEPITTDTLVRISSNTKPVTASLAMSLIEEGLLRLHDPVEQFVPELAARRVLRHLGADLEDTVPAERLITVEDLLTILWYSWPEQRTAAVLLTQVLPPSSELIAVFTSAVEATLDGRPTDARTADGSRSPKVPASPREGG